MNGDKDKSLGRATCRHQALDIASVSTGRGPFPVATIVEMVNGGIHATIGDEVLRSLRLIPELRQTGTQNC